MTRQIVFREVIKPNEKNYFYKIFSSIFSRRDKGTKGQSISIREEIGGSEFVFCKHFTKRNVNILTF